MSEDLQFTPLSLSSFYLFFFGLLLFSGSLYLLALSPLKWLGPITPIGGLLLMSGWLSLLLWKSKSRLNR